MRLALTDLRDKKFKKALDRTLLRIVPAREALELKDAALLVFTIINQFLWPTWDPPDRAVIAASDAVHLAFQLAYRDPDLAVHAAQALLATLAPDPVSISIAMICVLIKWSPSKSP